MQYLHEPSKDDLQDWGNQIIPKHFAMAFQFLHVEPKT